MSLLSAELQIILSILVFIKSVRTSAKSSSNNLLSSSKTSNLSKLSSNSLLSSSKIVRNSVKLSSTIIHSHLATGSCSEKNPTAELYRKTREAAEYCIALHLPWKKTKTESWKHTVLKQATIGFFHRSISSKPSIKSPMGNGSAATWLLESQIYYNDQTLMVMSWLLVLKFEVPSLME
ncbi:hypothetical protein ACFX2I_041002 [Malus domestica]